jgi:hypothetical protein
MHTGSLICIRRCIRQMQVIMLLINHIPIDFNTYVVLDIDF